MADGGGNLRCNCYKVPGLSTPILETPHISYISDRYMLREQLGWGQFGVIRACSDLVTGEVLACKSIAKDRLVSPEDVRSVKLEIEVMARLSGHPNVVDLKVVYEDENNVHLVMELCAGGELFHRLEKHGPFSEREAAVLFRHLMEVVAYCHDNGIVHRDLKPENILLATKSSCSPIKLADFGLATYIKPGMPWKGQSLYGTVGSPFYIAPEVLAACYNQEADVWSAGVILYILLSGMPPFWGKTKSKIFDAVRSAVLRFPSDPWDDVSESAKELVAGMLCRDTLQRLTAKQVLEHSWIEENAKKLEFVDMHSNLAACGQEDLSNSFPAPTFPSGRDVSFGLCPPVKSGSQPDPSSPTFTCRTSFSLFHGNATPSSPTIGLSFLSSSSMGFSPPVSLMTSSFSFFSPPPPTNEKTSLFDFTTNETSTSTIQIDSSNCKLLQRAHNEVGVRKAACTSRAIGLHSKRNHTIGMGEVEQLDIMVSESIIRWASCTHLSGAASLRSSLVC